MCRNKLLRIIICYGLKVIITFVTQLLPNFQLFAFNIDVENPILITNNFDHSESHFGISVLLLKMNEEEEEDHHQSSNSPTGWILIGAPKANSSHPNHADLNEPGVIWRCSLGRNETNDCLQLYMDPTRGDFDPKNPQYAHKDWKNGGWLGGAMASSDERFVTCASRWVNRKFTVVANEPHFFMNGMCYWVPTKHITSDATNDTWPWLPMTPDHSYRLLPLVNRTRQSIITINSTSHDWIYGQSGFSLHLTQKNELLLGAPGIDDWTGSVVQYIDNPMTPVTEYRRFNSGNQKEFKELWVAQSIRSRGGQTFEYFGYAVTSGHFFDTKDDRPQYAGSAPRAATLSGQVYVFSLRKSEDNHSNSDVAIDLLANITGHWNPSSFYGSYFGYALLAVDIDNDNFDELIVGAPLYSSVEDPANLMFSDPGTGGGGESSQDNDEDIKKKKAKADSDDNPFDFKEKIVGDEGCAFVFFSDGQRFKSDDRQILCGDKIPASRFGSAISSLGDLNQDNYNDVAIGAPYEDDKGAVYIYHGSPSGLILSQKLTPVHDSTRGFGYSISSGVDIDKNFYPDLAIGCYQSNQVMVYRTIPLVHMKGQLSTSLRELWTDQNEFNVTSCMSFEGISLPPVLNFQVTIILDKRVRERRLVEWMKVDNNGAEDGFKFLHFGKYNLTYLASFESSETCFNLTAQRIPDAEGLTHPIEIMIEQEMHLEDYAAPTLKPKLIHYQIYRKDNGEPDVNSEGSKADFKDIYGRRPLEMTRERRSLVSTLLPISSLCKDHGNNYQGHVCVANLSLAVIFQSQPYSGTSYKTHDKKNPYILGSSETVSMKITLKNEGELANLPLFVRISWSHKLIVDSTRGDCKKITILSKNQSETSLVECNLRRPLKNNKTEKVELEFNMKDRYIGEAGFSNKHNHFNISAYTSSNLAVESSSIFHLWTGYKTEIVLHYSEEPKEVPYLVNRNLTMGTVTVQQEFGINLKGPSAVFAMQLEFRVPLKVKIEQNWRTLTDSWRVKDLRDDSIIVCRVHNNNEEDNILSNLEEWRIGTENLILNNNNNEKLQVQAYHQNNNNNNQTTIQLVDNVKKMNLLSGFFNRRIPGHQMFLNCTLKNVKCILIKCQPTKYSRTKRASFLLRFRLFSHTAELFEDVEGVGIQSDVRVKVLNESLEVVAGLEKYGRLVSLLRIPQSPDIPIWIIIVSVVTGLVLLAIIIFLFTKCGFFKRKKRESLQSLQRQYEISERFKVDNDGRFYDADCQRDIRFD